MGWQKDSRQLAAICNLLACSLLVGLLEGERKNGKSLLNQNKDAHTHTHKAIYIHEA